MGGLVVEARSRANGVHLKVTYEGGSEIGDLTVRNDGGTLKGSGTIHPDLAVNSRI